MLTFKTHLRPQLIHFFNCQYTNLDNNLNHTVVLIHYSLRKQPGYMDEFLMDGDESDASSASSASSSSSSSDWGEMGLTLLDERDRQRLSSAGSQERRRATSGADSSSQDVNYRYASDIGFRSKLTRCSVRLNYGALFS